MLMMESRGLASFVLSHRLLGAHCTVFINKDNHHADYVIVDDTCVYQYHESKLEYIYFEPTDELVFAFQIPNVIQFTGDGASLRFNVQSTTKMMELNCNKPYFNSIVKLDDNYSDKIDSITGEFISLKPYAPILKAIKCLKGLATELSTSIHVELGSYFWTVSVSQCCIFGAASGIKGSITSQLFEKIYDFEASVCQVSASSLLVKKIQGNDFYLVHVPISRNAEFPATIPKMVAKCKEICTSKLTPDVGMITGEIIRNIKRDSLTLVFSDERLDIKYITNQVSLSTQPRDVNVKGKVSITIPAKSLAPVVDILSESTLVTTNGEYLCLTRDSKGLLISGIIS